MHKVGILSDEHFYKNCIEYQPLRPGIAEKIFPYRRNALPGVRVPKTLPVAYRGNTLIEDAISIAQRTGRPVEQIIEELKRETIAQKHLKLTNIMPDVKINENQASLLAINRRPRDSDYQQLTGDTGPINLIPHDFHKEQFRDTAEDIRKDHIEEDIM